jgi:hypothetical protein
MLRASPIVTFWDKDPDKMSGKPGAESIDRGHNKAEEMNG